MNLINMSSLELKPMTTNHAYITTCASCRKGRILRFPKKEAKEYMKIIAESYDGKLLEGDIVLHIGLTFSDNRKHDADNYTKLVIDALEGKAYKNDNQIKQLTVVKHPKAEKASLTYSILEVLNGKDSN